MASQHDRDEAYARQLQDEENQQHRVGSPIYDSGSTPVAIAAQVTVAKPAQQDQRNGPALQATVVRIPADGQEYDMVNSTSASMVDFELTHREAYVLSYRYTVRCLAFIDFVFTLLNLLTGATDALYGLILLLGPMCGYSGASRLGPQRVLIYLCFCIFKLVFQIFLLTMTQSAGSFALYFIIALIQLWIVRVVYAFWSGLNSIPQERLELIRNPHLIQAAPVAFVYW